MRRGRVFIYLALILVLILVGGYYIYVNFLQPPDTSAEDTIAEVPVVIDLVDIIVVTQPTARGSILDETILGVVQIPRELFIPGMFTDMAQVVTRRAKFDLDTGITLTASMLVESIDALSSTGSIAALTIPKGMVAVSIPIKRLSSVSYAPRPGDHVSVIVILLFVDLDSEFQSRLPNNVGGILAPGPGLMIGSGTAEEPGSSINTIEGLRIITAQIANGGTLALKGRTDFDTLLNELFYILPSERQRPRVVAQTLLSDVTVLKVGSFKYQEEEEYEKELADEQLVVPVEGAVELEPVPGEDTAEPERPLPPDVISLIVTPQDAVTLNYLIYSGSELTLALRSAGDDEIILTEAATMQYLLDQYNIPIPAKLPYGLEPAVDVLVPPVLENDIEPEAAP